MKNYRSIVQERAGLIIAVTDRQLARRPDSLDKVITDKELFGTSIPNPYPDDEDEKSLKKYRKVCKKMKGVINDNFTEILKRAKANPSV